MIVALHLHTPFTLEVDNGVERLKPSQPALKYIGPKVQRNRQLTFLVNTIFVYIDMCSCVVNLIWGLIEDKFLWMVYYCVY